MEPEGSRLLAGKDYERPPRTPQEAADELTALTEELGLYDVKPGEFDFGAVEARVALEELRLKQEWADSHCALCAAPLPCASHRAVP